MSTVKMTMKYHQGCQQTVLELEMGKIDTFTILIHFNISLDEPDELEELDSNKARFPLCITWTPIPLITWLIPCIGHAGIAHSNGKIHDFAGPYFIGIDDFAFGETAKYV